MAKIADLFVGLGFEADDKKLKKFMGGLDKSKIAMAGLVVGATAVVIALNKISQASIKAAVDLSNFENQTGLSAQKLQMWQNVAEQSNVSANAMAGSLKNVQKQIAAIQLGQGNISPFQMLGIDVMGDAFSVMEQVRASIKGLDRATATNLIEQMGFSPEMINVLQLSRAELEAMQGIDLIMNKEDVAILNKAEQSITKVNQSMKRLSQTIGAALAPLVIVLADGFTAITRNKLLISYLKAIINSVLLIIDVISTVVTWIGHFIKNIWEMGKGVQTLIVVLGILGIALLASPIGIFIAGILLLIAVLDDLYMWQKGKKSIMGSIFGDKKQSSEPGGQSTKPKVGFMQKMALNQIQGLGNMMGGGPSGGVTQTNNTNITVEGVDKPEETKEAVKTALNDSVNKASLQLNNGGI